MEERSQITTNSAENSMTEQSEPEGENRVWPRVRFRLRTLLLLPVVVAVLLLVAFPKLITGDFVEVTIVSINEYGDGVKIEMDARVSSDTGYGATNALYGGGLGVSSRSQSHWTHFIPTWPKRQMIIVSLNFNRAKLPLESALLTDVLVVQLGETHYVTPNKPLELAHARYIDGNEGRCRFETSHGSRLGL